MAGRVTQEVVETLIASTSNVRATQEVVEALIVPEPPDVRATQVVVEVLVEVLLNSVFTVDSFSLSDAVEVLEVSTAFPLTIEVSDTLALSDEAATLVLIPHYEITITDAFSNWDDKARAQRRNAPNVPVEVSDAFGDAFEIVGDFGLQIDTIRDNEIGWETSEALVLCDEAYVSEVNGFEFADELTLGDALETLETLVVEVYDSMQDVWYSEDEEELVEVSLAVPLELAVEDSFELSDALEFVRADEREVADRFTLADSVRVRFEHYLEITGDLLALSDVLEVGWNPSIEVEDSLNLDDAGGVSTLIPSHIEIEVGVSDTRLVVTEGLALFDGDFSTQGTEIFLGGTRLSYLRRYLNDVPR